MVEIRAINEMFCLSGKTVLRDGSTLAVTAVYENSLVKKDDDKLSATLEYRFEKAFKDFIPTNETVSIVNKIREVFKEYEESSLTINIDSNNTSIMLFFENGNLNLYRRSQNGAAIRYVKSGKDADVKLSGEAVTTPMPVITLETIKLAISEINSFPEKETEKDKQRRHV